MDDEGNVSKALEPFVIDDEIREIMAEVNWAACERKGKPMRLYKGTPTFEEIIAGRNLPKRKEINIRKVSTVHYVYPRNLETS